MARFTIKTNIDINATQEEVWQVLTDFDQYPAWNPFITKAVGDFRLNETVAITAGGMNFTPKIIAFEKLKEIRWVGRLFFKGLFDGEHTFLISKNEDGTIRFQHNEHFSGLLVGFFKSMLESKTKKGFEEMNQQLKALAEQAHNAMVQ